MTVQYSELLEVKLLYLYERVKTVLGYTYKGGFTQFVHELYMDFSETQEHNGFINHYTTIEMYIDDLISDYKTTA